MIDPADLSQRLVREGARNGEVTVSLGWNTRDDLDLHVIAPSGEELCYGNRQSSCGGHVDVCMAGTGRASCSSEPVEHICWSRAPDGTYRVFVRFFVQEDEGYRGKVSQDAVPWTVVVGNQGRYQQHGGYINGGESLEVAVFTVGHVVADLAWYTPPSKFRKVAPTEVIFRTLTGPKRKANADHLEALPNKCHTGPLACYERQVNL